MSSIYLHLEGSVITEAGELQHEAIKTKMKTVFFTFTTHRGQEVFSPLWIIFNKKYRTRVGGEKGENFQIPGNSDWHS